MQQEEPSVRASIDRWIRELTIRGDDSLSRSEQAALVERVNPPTVSPEMTELRLDPEQREALKEGLDTLVACMSYDYAAHMAVDEVLINMLLDATGQSRAEVLQEVGLALSEVPALRLEDPESGL